MVVFLLASLFITRKTNPLVGQSDLGSRKGNPKEPEGEQGVVGLFIQKGSEDWLVGSLSWEIARVGFWLVVYSLDSLWPSCSQNARQNWPAVHEELCRCKWAGQTHRPY